MGMTLIDLNEIFPMKPSEFKIFLSGESYDKKTAENCLNFHDTDKHIISKQSKISISVFYSKILKLESKLCQNFLSLSLTLSEM